MTLKCREILIEYSEHVQSLGQILFGLLSEALGLNPSHLTDMGCMEGHGFVCHYYPACPEPDRTIGHAKHCDPDFLTILLQDQIGGLQVLHEDHWIDIPPLEGALIVNIGDLLQVYVYKYRNKKTWNLCSDLILSDLLTLSCKLRTRLVLTKLFYEQLSYVPLFS